MHFEHPALQHPPQHAGLWRYMDFMKFLALLEHNALHLSRLSDFNDPFEGHPPRSVIETRRRVNVAGLTPQDAERKRKDSQKTVRAFASARHQIYASCWHVSDVESAAMWSLYQRQGDGIAVKTTYGALIRSLKPTENQLMGGLVQYVDYDTFEPSELNVLSWATLKRRSFSHEQEYRLFSFGPDESVSSVSVSVDLGMLIERIYLAPTMPQWTSTLLGRVMERYLLEKPLQQSTLTGGPSYYAEPR